MNKAKVRLDRTLSLSAMVFYGLGTIVGAGIYVLIGEIAGRAGVWAPLSFMIAAAIASFTGLSYAELVGRYPRSAGEAVYVQAAFQRKWLTQLTGWSVVFTGLVSAATLLKGFSGYFTSLFGGDAALVIAFVMLATCILACSGVKQSVGLAVSITVLELAGLALVMLASAETLAQPESWQQWYADLATPPWLGIAAAAFLAFYAFIGFEDMVNMAEEVKDAEQALPKAIVLAIVVSAGVYLVVAMVAVVAAPVELLAESQAPMATIVAQSSWFPVSLLSLISLVAILNGVIVQLLMASRVVYGLTQKSQALQFLSVLNRRTHVPVRATLVISVLILCFSLFFPLARLAQITSSIILLLFIVVNFALLVLKRRENEEGESQYTGFVTPKYIPVLGIVTSALLFVGQFYI